MFAVIYAIISPDYGGSILHFLWDNPNITHWFLGFHSSCATWRGFILTEFFKVCFRFVVFMGFVNSLYPMVLFSYKKFHCLSHVYLNEKRSMIWGFKYSGCSESQFRGDQAQIYRRAAVRSSPWPRLSRLTPVGWEKEYRPQSNPCAVIGRGNLRKYCHIMEQ